MLNHAYLVGPTTTPLDLKASGVAVKVSLAGTSWSPGTLYRFPVGTRPLQVIGGRRCGMLTAAQLRQRIDWCEIREA